MEDHPELDLSGVGTCYSNNFQPSIISVRSPTTFFLLDHVKRKCPRRGRTADDAHLLHGGELSFGNSQLVMIQAAGFCKNLWARTSEKVVVDWMVRRRGNKPSEERTSLNSRSRLETHLGVERRAAHREEDGGGEEGNKMAVEPREELLKNFWLARSSRRL